MATRKKAGKKKGLGRLDIGTDPPILVGGGGSSYVWIKIDQLEAVVNPTLDDDAIGVKNGAPTPHTRSAYLCFRLKHTHTKFVVNNGMDGDEDNRVKKDSVCRVQSV